MPDSSLGARFDVHSRAVISEKGQLQVFSAGALQLLKYRRELAAFLDLLSKAGPSAEGNNGWQNVGSGVCPAEDEPVCFPSSLASSVSDFVGWGLWHLVGHPPLLPHIK